MLSSVHSSVSFSFPSSVNGIHSIQSDDLCTSSSQASFFKADNCLTPPSLAVAPKASQCLKASKLSKAPRFTHFSSIFGESLCCDTPPGKPCLVNTSSSVLGIFNGSDLSEERNHENSGMDDVRVPAFAMAMPFMKANYSSSQGVTLERSKLDLSVKETRSTPQLDIGGGGGDLGNKNFHGGGDGGDDGGDDDDYFGDEDDGEDGDGDGILRKSSLKEIFDRATVEAVMKEWVKTMSDLPAGIRQAVELGIMSTAQLVRYFSIGSRPTLARKVSRVAPESLSRSFLGRVMGDPAFIFKFGIEQLFTLGTGVLWEVQSRGEKLKDEWDLAAVNVLTLMASNAIIVWTLSPSRSYWSTARYDWHKMLEKLPNHVFDKSYPLREFNTAMRVSSFFYKAAELSLFGSIIGSINGVVSNALLDIRKNNANYSPSVPVPSVQTCALANGAFMGLSGNFRYQLLYGLDRVMHQHLNSLTTAILGSTALRYANIRLGEPSRIAWLGLDMPKNAKDAELSQQSSATPTAYHRPSLSSVSSSPSNFPSITLPFALPAAVVAALPFLANKSEPKTEGQAPPPPSRRLRRKVKRKVSMAA